MLGHCKTVKHRGGVNHFAQSLWHKRLGYTHTTHSASCQHILTIYCCTYEHFAVKHYSCLHLEGYFF